MKKELHQLVLLRGLCMAALLLLCADQLSGCAEIRESMGYEKTAPDEFQVIAHVPLQVPEIFDLFPPAIIGTQRPQEQLPVHQASQTLMGEWHGGAESGANHTPEVEVFLRNVGRDSGWSDIRAVVDHEASTTLFEQRRTVY